MSNNFRLAVIGFIVAAFFMSDYALGQGFDCYASPAHAPIWQQIGNVNPYSRPYSKPIWQVYSPVQPYGRYLAVPSNFYTPVHPPVLTEPQVVSSSPFIDINPPVNMTYESQNQLVETPPSPVDSSTIKTESGAPDLDPTDAQPSPSDLVLNDPLQEDPDIDETAVGGLEPTENSDDTEIAALRAKLLQKNAENQELTRNIDRLKSMVEGKILEAIKETKKSPAKPDPKKLVDEAVKKERKAAAWEMAKASREAERANALLKQTRKQAEQERKKLLQRIQAVEAKLKENGRNKPNEKALEPRRPAKTSKKTLAELAEQKRKQRAQAEAKTPDNSHDSKNTSRENVDNQMKMQIDRAVGKIKRRFESKIERLRETDGSENEIEKLTKEMQIQIEKMESRIKNRFKRRLQGDKSER